MADEKQPEYVTVDQAADYLEVHPETIRRLLRDHSLQGKKTFTGQWKVDWNYLVEFQKNYRPTGE